MYRHLRAEKKRRATPAIYADERNLCLKRRELEQVKSADTLDPKGKVSVPHCLHISEEVSHSHTRRIADSYGSLESIHTELGNSETA
jgi:hypothetical protein